MAERPLSVATREREWRAAAAIAVGTVVFGALVRIVARGGDAATAGAIIAAFLDLDAAILGVFLGVSFVATSGARWTRGAAVGLAVAVNAWAIVGLGAHRVLGEHVSLVDPDTRVASVLRDAPALLGSAIAEAGWAMLGCVALLAIGVAVVVRASALAASPGASRRVLVVFVVAQLSVAAVVTLASDGRRERHAAVALFARPAVARWAADASLTPDSVLRVPRFGEHPADSTADAQLAAFAAGARSRRAPNVLFVILESIGGEQLLRGGLPDARLTPNLARLAARGVVFPNLYTVYPATTRAHVPMMTGGAAITWGSVFDELTYPYGGPTLPGVLRAAGYRTGLFAAVDMRFAKLDDFYRAMPWDTLLHVGDGTGPMLERERVHSWGVNEDHMWTHAVRWLDSPAAQGSPFLLNLQTISAHHPYGVGPGFRGPRAGDDRLSRYLNSVAYTDHVLGRVIADVERRSAERATLVVITGDHGQAFGDKHAGNFTHRGYLYEENVRSFGIFAMVGGGANTQGAAIVSERIGSLGDLMPSVLGLLGVRADSLAGQDLFGASFAPQLVYFHKDAGTQQWGLRDGQWKFIDRVESGAPELYDLGQDPNEQTNIAARHGDMVDTYRTLVRDWYVRSNYDYVARLSGYRPPEGGAITRARLTRRGMRDVRVGAFLPDDFVEQGIVHPNAQPTIYMRWFVNDRTIPIRIRMVSPSRAVHVYRTSVGVDASSSWYRVPLETLEPGRWTVDVWSGARRLGRTTFEVR